MRITLHGAAREVTGSCYHLQSKKSQILVDCGMFQGSHFSRSKNFEDFDFDPKKLDAVFVTHAHMDHTGRLPKLVKEGFKGPIYMTPPTADIAALLLRDAVSIMEQESRLSFRPMLYEKEDAERTISQFKTLEDRDGLCFKDLTVDMRNAGHIFGSCFYRFTEDSTNQKVVFSGDLGNTNTPLLQPKDDLLEADLVFIESTYGHRIHESEESRSATLKKIILDTIKRRGVLLIPTFAVERTQELLYEFNHLAEHGLMPRVNMFLDSPMAIHANDILNSHPEYYSRKALKLISLGDKLYEFPGLKITESRDESKMINEAPRPKVIIAGSGMMNGGRILHHLVRYLGDAKNTLMIIGYQAENTLGRKLYSGEKKVQVLNEFIDVKANVVSIGGYSAHGDQNMLMDWVASAKTKPGSVMCTHGDEAACSALATAFVAKGYTADTPRYGQVLEV